MHHYHVVPIHRLDSSSSTTTSTTSYHSTALQYHQYSSTSTGTIIPTTIVSYLRSSSITTVGCLSPSAVSHRRLSLTVATVDRRSVSFKSGPADGRQMGADDRHGGRQNALSSSIAMSLPWPGWQPRSCFDDIHPSCSWLDSHSGGATCFMGEDRFGSFTSIPRLPRFPCHIAVRCT